MSVAVAFEWHHVLFANWPVDPESVAERLPRALDVDTYEGSAWLSIVPLLNVAVRPRVLPVETGADAPELNLRTYVTHDGDPGVYFFSLDVASILGTVGARVTHHLPYFYARMTLEDRDGRVSVTSRRLTPGSRPAGFEATYRPTGDRFEADPGSVVEFLTERRRLYTQGTDGSVRFTDVDHGRWPLHEATCDIRENSLFEANGFATPSGEPRVYYSPRVSVTTSRSRRIS